MLSDRGLHTMEHVRAVVAGMEDEESRLERDRDASYRRTIALTFDQYLSHHGSGSISVWFCWPTSFSGI